jgi:hypothetical protein
VSGKNLKTQEASLFFFFGLSLPISSCVRDTQHIFSFEERQDILFPLREEWRGNVLCNKFMPTHMTFLEEREREVRKEDEFRQASPYLFG